MKLPKGRNFSAAFSPEQNKKFDGPFYFIQMADTQLGLMSATKGYTWLQGFLKLVSFGYINLPKDLNPELDSNQAYEAEKKMFEEAVHLVNDMNPPPAFVVVCGDLVDAFPNNVANRSKQVRDFKDIAQKFRSDVPLVCLCGNHDIGNQPTKESIELYKNDFGDDYYSFWCRGVKFLVINSQLHADPKLCTEIASEHDQWIDKQLSHEDNNGEKPKHTIIFSHIPPFINSIDEPTGYFNYEASLRKRLINKFREAGVTKWFCGHYHRNAGGWIRGNENDGVDKNRLAGDFEVVITAAVGTNIIPSEKGDPLNLSGMGAFEINRSSSGFRIVDVNENDIQHKWHSIDSLSKSKL